MMCLVTFLTQWILQIWSSQWNHRGLGISNSALLEPHLVGAPHNHLFALFFGGEISPVFQNGPIFRVGSRRNCGDSDCHSVFIS